MYVMGGERERTSPSLTTHKIGKECANRQRIGQKYSMYVYVRESVAESVCVELY